MEVQPQELTLLAQQWPVWGAGMNSGVGVGGGIWGFHLLCTRARAGTRNHLQRPLQYKPDM